MVHPVAQVCGACVAVPRHVASGLQIAQGRALAVFALAFSVIPSVNGICRSVKSHRLRYQLCGVFNTACCVSGASHVLAALKTEPS
jgi:hypothetical protein